MAKKPRENCITQYIKVFFPNESKKTPVPIKDQSQIPFLFDVLSRKNQHHVLIKGSTSETFNITFLETMAPHFSDEQLPQTLRESYFFYLDINQLILNTTEPEHIEQDFADFCCEIINTYKRVILAINHIEPLLSEDGNTSKKALYKIIKSVLLNDQWRLIVITQNSEELNSLQHSYLQSFLTPLKLSEPTIADSLLILKSIRDDLENFHHIIIPDPQKK